MPKTNGQIALENELQKFSSDTTSLIKWIMEDDKYLSTGVSVDKRAEVISTLVQIKQMIDNIKI